MVIISVPTSVKVTIVIPVYNREKYIVAALESVLAQTFTDFELLVIDDGSTDRSVALARSYGDPRMRLVCHTTNLGVAKTRNQGLQLARGEYLAFLDSDDWAYPARLAKQVAFLDHHPDYAAVGAWIEKRDECSTASSVNPSRQTKLPLSDFSNKGSRIRRVWPGRWCCGRMGTKRHMMSVRILTSGLALPRRTSWRPCPRS